MPRRDRDPRPTIEVIGGAPTEESMQDVAVGDPRRSRRWWAVLLVGVIAGAGLVTVVGGDDDGGESATSSTTRSTVRRTTTSSTSSTLPAPLGPLLDEPTGASILLAGQTGAWALLDLDTGTFTRVDERGGDVFGGLVSVRGGVVLADGNRSRYVPLLDGGDPVELGGGSFLLSAGRDDRVWVADSPGPEDPIELRLVDLRGRTLARSEMPQSSYFGATASGPIVNDGGRAYLNTSDGLRFLGIGQPVGTMADRVALRECDEEGECTTALVNVVTGERQELAMVGSRVGSASGFGGSIQVSPAGDIVAVDYDAEGDPHLRWLDPSGSLVGAGVIDIEPSGFGFGGDLSFLPGRLGIVWASGTGEVTRIWPEDGQLRVEALPISTSRGFDRAIVIRP